MLFSEFDAAPIINRVVTDVFQTGICRHGYNHRHVLYIEAADKEETALVERMRIGRDVLQQDVPVDVR